MSFLEDKKLGDIAEKLVSKILNKAGFPTTSVVDKTERSYYDLMSVSKEGHSFTSEVKFDAYEAKSGNIAIEYYNSKLDKPSGINITKSNFWFIVLSRGIWISNTKVLKDFCEVNKPIKDLKNVGDGNACIKLYNSNKILDSVFHRIDNIKIELFRSIIYASIRI